MTDLVEESIVIRRNRFVYRLVPNSLEELFYISVKKRF